MIVLGSFDADKHVIQIRREGYHRGRGERWCHRRASFADYDPSRRGYFDQRLVSTIDLAAYLFDPLQRENNGIANGESTRRIMLRDASFVCFLHFSARALFFREGSIDRANVSSYNGK